MIYRFGDVELDTRLYELRRAGEPCPVEPQVFNVLVYLVEHADHVVTKDELLENLWPGRVVGESALTSRLKTARRLIGDTGREQRFIRTVHGRGYRFVGTLECTENGQASAPAVRQPGPSAAPVSRRAPANDAVGREAELAMLEQHLAGAETGELQVVFIEGEAGIGKTTLIEAFVEHAESQGRARIACGQCAEPSAAGEAFMPVLDALDSLGTGPAAAEVVACLEDVAPSWLLQLPALAGAERRERLEGRVVGVTAERMLREFAAAARALSTETPLVLVLEDLHWSDPSTLALLAWLGRRRVPMRVLVLCSHRPREDSEIACALAETVYGLRLRGLARLIALAPLGREAVDAYLVRRFRSGAFPEDVVASLHAHTEGHPLFVVSVIESWIESGRLVESTDGWRLEGTSAELFAVVPANLRLLIEEQLRRLGPMHRRLLEAASVVGDRFASVLVETLIGEDCERCEAELRGLAEASPFVVRESDVDWPDGTLASQFRFRHTLYRETLYSSLPARQRARLHAAVAERLEQAFGEAAAEHAIDLAHHWSAAGNPDRAVRYRLAAVNQAFGRGGYREAAAHIEQGLELLERHPELPDHDSRELDFRLLQANALIQTNGWSDARAEAALERGLVLAESLDDTRISSVLYMLAAVHELRGEYAESRRCLERQQALPRPFASPLAQLESHELMACSTFHQGAFETALEHAEAGLSAADVFDTESRLYVYGENPRVSCHNWAGLALWFLGHSEEARRRIDEALALARRPARKYSLSNALCQAATLHELEDEPEAVLELAREAVDVALEEGFTYPLAVGRILLGWALVRTGRVDEGVAAIAEGLEGHRASGANMDRPYYLGLLAEAQAAAGQWDQARETLDGALKLIDASRRFFHEAELLRLRAELALAPGGEDPDEARQLLARSLEAARSQGNRIGERRAEAELAKLTQGTCEA